MRDVSQEMLCMLPWRGRGVAELRISTLPVVKVTSFYTFSDTMVLLIAGGSQRDTINRKLIGDK